MSFQDFEQGQGDRIGARLPCPRDQIVPILQAHLTRVGREFGRKLEGRRGDAVPGAAANARRRR